MAKARDIAALAGLAGLAYAMRNKGDSSGMTPEQNDTLADVNRVSKMSEDSDTLARVNRNMSPGQSAVDDANAGVLNALSTPKVAPNDKAGNQGVLSSKSLTPKAKPQDKQNIVSKKQLDNYKDKFGQDKTLRDYMNSQRASKNAPIKPISLPDSYKRGGATKMASGGMTASSRADGCATKGKTRGKIC